MYPPMLSNILNFTISHTYHATFIIFWMIIQLMWNQFWNTNNLLPFLPKTIPSNVKLPTVRFSGACHQHPRIHSGTSEVEMGSLDHRTFWTHVENSCEHLNCYVETISILLELTCMQKDQEGEPASRVLHVSKHTFETKTKKTCV